jgi:hypothetical protein
MLGRFPGNGSQEGNQNSINLTALMSHIDCERRDVQHCYGLWFCHSERGSIDIGPAAHCFKLSADQGNADDQRFYGECLGPGIEMSTDLKSAGDSFKFM